MKFTKILAALMLFAVCAVNAQTTIKPYNVYATTGTFAGGGTLTNSAIIGAYTANGGAPVITFLYADAVHATAQAKFYRCTNYTHALGATVNTRTNYVGSTNGFDVDRVVVVRHLSNDTYERLVCAAPQNTNIVFASDPVQALAVGDIIYQQTAGGTITCQTNTAAANAIINIVGDGIYSGQPGYPLLIDMITVVGTNGTIRAVNAKFIP